MNKILRKIVALELALVLALASLASPALAQSSPGWTYGYVPTPAQWNAAFAGKQDYVGSAFLPLSGGTMTGRLTTSTPNSSGAGFTLPQGADPSSPNNGDVWTTSAGLKTRINGVTYNLTAGGLPLAVGTTTILGGSSGAPLSNNAGVLANGLVASTWSTFLQIGTGAVSRTVQNKLATWFDVKDFGAVGDGVTDDAPAIRLAIAALDAAGGGLLTFPCAPLGYRVASFEPGTGPSGGSIFNYFGNTTFSFCGAGGKIFVANNMNTVSQSFFVFYPTSAADRDNVTFRNAYIDFNGANNSCGGTCQYNNIGIGISHGINFAIDGGTFYKNPGSQDVAVNGTAGIGGGSVTGATIRNTVHIDACDVVNAACTDHSSIFVAASQFTIENNRCQNTTQSTKSTCWEQHGDHGVSYGNVVNKYAKFYNIAAITVSGSSVFATNQTVIGNSGNSCAGGSLWFDNSGGALSDILIEGNNFVQTCTTVGTYHDWNATITAVGAKRLVYRGNHFNSTVAAGGAGTACALTLGRSAEQIVVDNTWDNGLGPAVCNGTFAASTSFRIDDNNIVDAGQTSTAGSRRGILISSGTTILYASIKRNVIRNVASTYMTTCLDVTLNASTESTVFENDLNCATPSSLTLAGSFITYPAAGIIYVRNPAGPLGATAQGLDNQLLQGVTAGAPTWLSVGTGVRTALGVNVGSAGAFVVQNGALGTPSSGNGSNITNVNAATLNGATFASPGAIGGGSAAAANFTSVSTSSFLAVGTVGLIGAGGTGSAIGSLTLSGGSGAAGGAQFVFTKNSITTMFFGTRSSITTSGTSNNFLLQMFGGFGNAMEIDYTTGEAIFYGPSVLITPTVVNSLPTCNAGADGKRAFVTNNATATAFAGAVTTGGANHHPVYCDGSASAWKQG